jgi:hypothetical protein
MPSVSLEPVRAVTRVIEKAINAGGEAVTVVAAAAVVG